MVEGKVVVQKHVIYVQIQFLSILSDEQQLDLRKESIINWFFGSHLYCYLNYILQKCLKQNQLELTIQLIGEVLQQVLTNQLPKEISGTLS